MIKLSATHQDRWYLDPIIQNYARIGISYNSTEAWGCTGYGHHKHDQREYLPSFPLLDEVLTHARILFPQGGRLKLIESRVGGLIVAKCTKTGGPIPFAWITGLSWRLAA